MATPATALDASPTIDTRLKISALWISMLVVFAYVDIFSLFKPGTIEDIQGGSIFVFDITQTFLFFTTLYIVIPTTMIYLSLVMKPRVNRAVNMTLASLYIVTVLGGAVGEWGYYLFGSAVEAVMLIGIVIHARGMTGPKTSRP